MKDSPPPPAVSPPAPVQARNASTVRLFLAAGFLAAAAIVLYFILRHGPAAPAPLKAAGAEYWLTVTSAEVSAKTGKGKAWDVDNSGPDVFYEIWWQGNRVYKSSTCTDTLIAKWDTQEIDVTRILRTHRLEASKAGAIVKLGEQNMVTIKLYDSDVTVNDLIEEFQVDLSALKTGVNTLGPGPSKQCLKLSLVMAPVEE
ncbi:MAG: hypothetical protein U0796_22560 [Gemmatales bacterium]